MSISFFDAEGNELGQSTTDANGMAKLDIDRSSSPSSSFIAVGQIGDEVTLAGMGSLWHQRTGSSYYRSRGTYSAFLNTDRPIYRPGDTVYFAAILRQYVDGLHQPVASQTPVTAKLKDSRGNDVETLTLVPDAYGMVRGQYILGAEPSLGTYRIRLIVGDDSEPSNSPTATFSQSLKVEEYVKPEYKVEVSTSEPHVISGDSFNVVVDANYFFGQPVVNADVQVKVYRSYNYRYDWWRNYYSDGGRYPSYGNRQLIESFSGTTDANGVWSQQVTADLDYPFGATYSVVATVADEQERPIQGRANVKVHWATFKLRSTVDKYGYDNGEPILVNLQARGHDNQPIISQTVQVKVEQRKYRNYEEVGHGKDRHYRYETYYDTITTESVTTDSNGNAQTSFSGLGQGWYRITSTTTDDRGREVEARTYAWVYDRSARRWYYYNDRELSLTLDQGRLRTRRYGPIAHPVTHYGYLGPGDSRAGRGDGRVCCLSRWPNRQGRYSYQRDV